MPNAPAPAAPPVTIMVVEDDAICAEFVQDLLKSQQYSPIRFANAREAMAWLETDPAPAPDLALLDVMLGGDMDGFQLCQWMKAHPRLRYTPVIMVTGRSTLDDKLQGLALGADDYLFKPFNNRELFAKIKSMLRMKSLQDELFRARALYQDLFENAPDAYLVIEDNGRIMQANRSAAGILGWTAAELAGRVFLDLVHPETQAQALELLRDGGAPAGTHAGELRLQDKSGRILDMHAHVSADASGEHPGSLRLILRDISELRRMQRTVLQSERLASLGQLSGGLTHELRNPMAIVYGAAQILEKEPDASSLAIECSQRIQREVDRANQIINSLVLFARQSEEDSSVVDLNQLVRETVHLFSYQLRKQGAELVQDLSDEPLRLSGHPAQIRQVIFHLTDNGIKALTGAGRVRISTRRQDESVVMEVSDSGRGIPAEHLDRIFDPFYTVSPLGASQGLGLSVTYGIVANHGGRMEAESREGRGTTVRVFLPRVPEV